MLPNNSLFDINNRLHWLTVKISLAICLCLYLGCCLFSYKSQPFPVGVCKFIDCASLTSTFALPFVTTIVLIASVLYVLEIYMIANTITLTIISVLLLSLEESNGMTVENGVLSMAFFAQCLAYLFHRISPESALSKNRLNYILQVVVAVYVLAGLSKLQTSGLNWFLNDAPKFALEIKRVLFAKYATEGNPYFLQKGNAVTTWLFNNLYFLRTILFSTLLIELLAFVMLFSRKISFFYAFVLLAMHLGIYLTMNITFPTIMLPMIIVTINPLYWSVLFANKCFRYWSSKF